MIKWCSTLWVAGQGHLTLAPLGGTKQLQSKALNKPILMRPMVAVCAATLVLAACAPGPKSAAMKTGGVYDPYESVNRGVHGFNKGVDKVFFGPTSKGYSSIVPDPIEDSFVSFSNNISMPRVATNALLQGDIKTFGIALARFTVNTTVGFVGLADPASDFKIPHVDADFGQTLHVWGFGEGAYLELPFLGPSNVRDAVGFVGDFGLNPLSYWVENPLQNAGTYSKVLEWMSDRGRYSDTVESILYDSADSYAQARLLYTQNRRFELGAGDDQGFDPYADPYGDPYSDTYVDPYQDPYSDLSEDPYAE